MSKKLDFKKTKAWHMADILLIISEKSLDSTFILLREFQISTYIQQGGQKHQAICGLHKGKMPA